MTLVGVDLLPRAIRLSVRLPDGADPAVALTGLGLDMRWHDGSDPAQRQEVLDLSGLRLKPLPHALWCVDAACPAPNPRWHSATLLAPSGHPLRVPRLVAARLSALYAEPCQASDPWLIPRPAGAGTTAPQATQARQRMTEPGRSTDERALAAALLAYAGEAGACAPAWADEAWAAMAPSMQAARDGGLVSTALVNLALAQAHRALAQGEPLQALPALQEVAGFGHRLQDPFTGAEAVCRALLLTSLVMIRCGEAAQAQAPLLAVHTMLQRATPLADPDRLADYEAYRKVVQLAIAAVNLRRTVGHDQARLPAVCRRVAEMAVHLFGAPRDRFMASIGLAGVDGTPEVRRVA